MMFELCPVEWTFKRRTLLHIIECTGKSQNEHALMFLMNTAVKLIEKADTLNGRPIQMANIPEIRENISVHFSIIFNDSESYEKFTKYIEGGRKEYR